MTHLRHRKIRGKWKLNYTRSSLVTHAPRSPEVLSIGTYRKGDWEVPQTAVNRKLSLPGIEL